MPDSNPVVEVRIDADTKPFADAMADLERLSQSFGTQLAGALRGAATGGKSLEDVLRRIGLNLASMALGQGLRPLGNQVGNLLASLVGGAIPGIGKLTPFASGGVVSGPTVFPMAGGAGLMGEAGAEAILPLRRGADGSLGVAAGQGGGVNVVFNVSTPDAGSFRKSEAQITGMLARVVSQGSRRL